MNPTELPHEIAERVRIPHFDDVRTRATAARKRRQRRATVGSIAAAAVIAGVGWQFLDAPRSDTGPATSAPSVASSPFTPSVPESSDRPGVDPRLPSDVRELLSRKLVHPWPPHGASDGTVAVTWRACKGARHCEFAVVTQDPDGDVFGRVLGSQPVGMAAVSDGWLLTQFGDDTLVRMRSDGDRVELRQGDWTEPRPGDEVVMLDGVGMVSYDATRAIAYRINQPLWQAGYQTPDGRLVVAEGNQKSGWSLRSTADGENWSSMRPRFDVPVVHVDVTGHGDHIFAVAVAQSDKDFFVPGAWVSSDGGESWLDVKGLDTGTDRNSAPQNPSGIAVDSHGNAYLSADGGLIMIDSEGNALPIPVVGVDRTPFASGDGVCMLGSDDHGPLMCSNDGTEWYERAIPGFVSGN